MKPITWKTDGNELTILAERGRVLQVSVQGEQAFWVNPEWTGNWNVGGDRLWVSPEIDWNWKKTDRVDFAQYDVPQALDSDHWTLAGTTRRSCMLRKQQTIRHQQRKRFVRYEITREIEHLTELETEGFDKALAYQTTNRLTLLDGTPGQAMDLWGLVQLPPGGSMLIPVRQKSELRNYFAPIPKRMFTDKDGLLELIITGQTQYKVGVPPSRTVGPIAYARPVRGGWLVVYRHVSPQFWRPYVDVPISDPRSQGDAVQVYNDGGEFGGFGELEYHSPGIRFGKGEQVLEDRILTIVGRVSKTRWPACKKRWINC